MPDTSIIGTEDVSKENADFKKMYMKKLREEMEDTYHIDKDVSGGAGDIYG